MDYLSLALKDMRALKKNGSKTIDRLNLDQLMHKPSTESNSLADIVKHLHGNMLSRWTDFLTADGEKDWRKREEEFQASFSSKEELFQLWEEGWELTLKTIENLNEEDLNKKIKIRGEDQSVVEAIQRQLVHYASHVGQMMYIGKMILNEEWESLSIPRGKSEEFLQMKLNQGR
ncbi:hypothetical protein JOC86_001489 [Bacillus pakistanensis]|uniref:DUF1572 domain-containing protein n=1 Tax=Rossellomorea pakistanensis TaxID=992288 RepID=A0ABS2NAS5_9BACI|nr:DUF1572 family protein [Bacillus pakistanensis]MBM7584952.1 hypothetical protein [Bacillus pakistanensis]